MTRASLREYAAVQRERYQQASRRDKHRLLDEMVAVQCSFEPQQAAICRVIPLKLSGQDPVQVTWGMDSLDGGELDGQAAL